MIWMYSLSFRWLFCSQVPCPEFVVCLVREHARVGSCDPPSAWTKLQLPFSRVFFFQPQVRLSHRMFSIFPNFWWFFLILGLETFFLALSCWVVSGVSMVHPAGNVLPDTLPLREVRGSHCQQWTYTVTPISSRRDSDESLSPPQGSGRGSALFLFDIYNSQDVRNPQHLLW